MTDEYIPLFTCAFCGLETDEPVDHLLRAHRMSVEEYFKWEDEEKERRRAANEMLVMLYEIRDLDDGGMRFRH